MIQGIVIGILALSTAFGGYSWHQERQTLIQQTERLEQIEAQLDALQQFGANQKITELTDYTTPIHNDVLPIVDTANGVTKKLKWGTATSTLKAIYDLIYSPIFSTSAGLAGLLSDETGSGGGFVRATSPTLTTPTINTPTFDVAGTDATGDIYYNGGSGVMTRLPIGSTNEFLRVSGGLPDWDNTVLLTNPQVASSTFTATSSFTWDNVNSRALIVNGLPYSWQSSRGASSSVLTEDGSGNLRFYIPTNTILYKSTGSSTVSQTSTTTAATVVVPANALGPNGTLRITAIQTGDAGGSNYRWELGFGNGLSTSTFMQIGGNYSSAYWNQINATISNMGTTSDQILRSQANGNVAKDTNTVPTFQLYYAGGGFDTTQKTYISFRAAESASGVAAGYKNILVELIRTP